MDKQKQIKEEELKKKKEEQQAKKSEEARKKELADLFGVDLKDIEHVFLDNGREYFKFVNPKDKTVKMIENIDYSNGMEVQFKNIQHELAFTQGKDKAGNANEIFEHNSEFKNTELKLISISELKNNRFTYNKEINRLNAVNKKKLKALLKSSAQLRIKLINIENAIGINENNEVIDVKYNYKDNKAEIKSAETISYSNTNEIVEDIDYVVDIPNETFDSLISGIEIIDNQAVVVNPSNISINGETISADAVVQCFNMPEIIEKSNLDTNKKNIITGLVSALKRKQQTKNMQIQKEKHKQKVLVKKDDKKAA